MSHLRTFLVLLGACLAAQGCSREVTRGQVTEFIQAADEAARKRFAPEICELRGRNFTLDLTYHNHEGNEPARLRINRKLFCQQAGSFSHVRQYRLERKSMEIDLAPDRRTATVTARYVETLPYYEPDRKPSTPDDFSHFQIVESRDVSVVGIEDGDLRILSTRAEAHQSLVGKNHVQLPYD